MKRLILFAAFCLATVPAAHASFSDVHPSHPNADAIDYLQTEEMVQGYADGSFKPDAPINRAEFLKIVAEAFEDPNLLKACSTPVDYNYLPYKQIVFSDSVSEDVWYESYICAATQHGTGNPVSGYPDGTFRPQNPISFVEAAKILVAYQETRMMEIRAEAGDKSTANPFSVSIPDPQHWFDRYVVYMERANAIPLSIRGFDQKITRGEMAEMIFRLHGPVKGKTSQTMAGLSSGQTLVAADVEKIQRYYELITDAGSLETAYAMRTRDAVSFEEFQSWYEKLMSAELYHMKRNPDETYTFLVLLREEPGEKPLFQVTMRVLGNGKLETIESKRLTGAELESVAEGGQYAWVMYDNEDLILYFGLVDGTTVEVARLKKDEGHVLDSFTDIRFSGSDRYLMYRIVGYEAGANFVFDLQAGKAAHKGYMGEVSGFTRNEEYYYSCSANELTEATISIFRVPAFEQIEVPFDGIVRRCGSYDLTTNSFDFTEVEGETEHTFDFTTRKLQ